MSDNSDINNVKNLILDFLKNKPTKDLYEKCLLQLINEKITILSNDENEEKNIILIQHIDKIIESILSYLDVASR